jgi:hypothetical protein
MTTEKSQLTRGKSPWWWRQYAPLTRRSTLMRLHGTTSQKALILINAAVRSWNLTAICWFAHCLRKTTVIKKSHVQERGTEQDTGWETWRRYMLACCKKVTVWTPAVISNKYWRVHECVYTLCGTVRHKECESTEHSLCTVSGNSSVKNKFLCKINYCTVVFANVFRGR